MGVLFTPKWFRNAAVALALALLPNALAAQHVLLAEDRGAMSVVVAAADSHPCVERDGKVVQIATQGYVLKKVPEYNPAFVTVTEVAAKTTSLNFNGTGDRLNNTFEFNARLETSFPLKDVFLVIAVGGEDAPTGIFLKEVGQLDPNYSRPVSIYVPVSSSMGSFRYSIHLFSEGYEVFHTMIPFWVREAALNKMVARRIKGVTAAAPRFLVGPAPVYPPSLKHDKVSGRAVVGVTISPKGAVEDPAVKSATDPAFGEAALAAIKDWRFLPKVADGHAVVSRADVPFIFSPPKSGGEGR